MIDRETVLSQNNLEGKNNRGLLNLFFIPTIVIFINILIYPNGVRTGDGDTTVFGVHELEYYGFLGLILLFAGLVFSMNYERINRKIVFQGLGICLLFYFIFYLYLMQQASEWHDSSLFSISGLLEVNGNMRDLDMQAFFMAGVLLGTIMYFLGVLLGRLFLKLLKL